MAQRRADGLELLHVPWSRHLLACLHRITGAELLIGARAVARHQHFQHYASPSPGGPAAGDSRFFFFQENQQDALRLTWAGIIAGRTDGGVDWKNERMGSGYVTGAALETETSFSASVGGPLSTLHNKSRFYPQMPDFSLNFFLGF
jgi:hypothetical protein